MRLIVGLGNPGKEYALNRHNVGFMAVDELAHRFSFADFKSKFQGLLAEGVIAGERVLILKPQTYMNLSGESVSAVARFYKINVKDIIVVHDDMDLPIGRVKVKIGGGSGGHNGIKSIDAHMGPEYERIRIGIGKPETRDEVVNYVLGNFSVADKQVLKTIFDKIADNMEILLTKDAASFMNKLS